MAAALTQLADDPAAAGVAAGLHHRLLAIETALTRLRTRLGALATVTRPAREVAVAAVPRAGTAGPPGTSNLMFRTGAAAVPALRPGASAEVRIDWDEELPSVRYQVGLAGQQGLVGRSEVTLLVQDRTGALVRVTAGEEEIGPGEVVTAAALYY